MICSNDSPSLLSVLRQIVNANSCYILLGFHSDNFRKTPIPNRTISSKEVAINLRRELRLLKSDGELPSLKGVDRNSYIVCRYKQLTDKLFAVTNMREVDVP